MFNNCRRNSEECSFSKSVLYPSVKYVLRDIIVLRPPLCFFPFIFLLFLFRRANAVASKELAGWDFLGELSLIRRGFTCQWIFKLDAPLSFTSAFLFPRLLIVQSPLSPNRLEPRLPSFGYISSLRFHVLLISMLISFPVSLLITCSALSVS